MNMNRSLTASGTKVKANARAAKSPAARQLLAWYDQHRRILPWRALAGETPDPYRVWLSEVMLQQTTVGAVAPYFQKFVQRWPNVADLAEASLDDVLRLCAGLGYYRRARSLHACAQRIMADYGGLFPSDEKALLDLPGFGPYTAAAVRAIAFDERANVVDGNVERVVARIFAIKTALPKAKPEIRRAAESLLPKSRHGDYAQALMDLGATICTPRNPKCDLCPWRKTCQARALGIADKLPRRAKAKAKPVRRAIAFVLVNDRDEILLRQRPSEGLLGGMMEVPSSAWKDGEMPSFASVKREAPIAARWKLLPGIVRHVFSHFELEITVAVGKCNSPLPLGRGRGRGYRQGSSHSRNPDSGGNLHPAPNPSPRGGEPVRPIGIWIPRAKLHAEALPSVMRKIIRHGIAG
jgi:A/G-specific adenine glycosylase